MFEITIIERDSLGNPVVDPNGRMKTKTFNSIRGSDIAEFWDRNYVRPANKKKNKNNSDVPSGTKHVEKIKKNKKNFDDGTRKHD
jgi:hypothetical protein